MSVVYILTLFTDMCYFDENYYHLILFLVDIVLFLHVLD